MKLFLCLCACFLLSGREVRGDEAVKLIHSWNKVKYIDKEEVSMVPSGLAHDYDGWRMFFGVPKRKGAIPQTLTYALCVRGVDVPMNPFPGKPKTPLVSVWQPVVDECRRLWVLDVGIGQQDQKDKKQADHPPAIIAFDLSDNKTFPEIFRHEITDSTAPVDFGGFAVDVPDPTKCGPEDPVFIYMTNYKENKLYVVQVKGKAGTQYSFSHDSFKPSEKSFVGTEYEYEAGLFGITLGDRDETADKHRDAYYLAGSSSNLWRVSTEVLRKGGSNFNPQDLGSRGENSDAIALSYDPATKAIFFGEVENRRITCWNTKKALASENLVEVYKNDDKLIYITDVAVDSHALLHFMSNGYNPIQGRKLDTDDIVVYEATTTDVVKGTKCEK